MQESEWYQQLIRVAVKMQSDKYEYRCTG